jgi:hypothetical protein
VGWSPETICPGGEPARIRVTSYYLSPSEPKSRIWVCSIPILTVAVVAARRNASRRRVAPRWPLAINLVGERESRLPPA